jgi:hypothetical protein
VNWHITPTLVYGSKPACSPKKQTKAGAKSKAVICFAVKKLTLLLGL